VCFGETGEMESKTLESLAIWQWDAILAGIERVRSSGLPIVLPEIIETHAQLGERVFRVEIFPNEGKKEGILILGQDITNYKTMEIQLQHIQKLEAIGQLAAGVAHELNTPIQYIGCNLSFIYQCTRDMLGFFDCLYDHFFVKEKNTDPSCFQELFLKWNDGFDLEFARQEIPPAISQSEDGLKKIAEIVKALKTFARPEVTGMVNADIHAALESMITVTRNEWKDIAEVKTNFDSRLNTVYCCIAEMNQVFLNIMLNAIQAIDSKKNNDSKGLIAIETEKDESMAIIKISDTGIGIPKKICDKIYNPFFTTKEIGKGTGYGLTLAYLVVVKKHNGQIDFVSEVGQGTTFFIRLPLFCAERDLEHA
jgi:signal transduction histidine kinase